MTSTETESPELEPSPSKTGGFAVPSSGGALAENTAKLEADLATEREERCEERFIWIAVVFILISAHVYASMDSVIAFICLFMLSLVLLVGIAKRLGVDWAVQGVGWLMHHIAERMKIDKE
ncbi:hypothetical protein [Agrobacterium tumefaciens]|uniref:hypothetical protein n=1 Tax=Agrobacterium tumefaciens TaxID=358 RepID=UPI001CBFC733|nr:hypothetical protein [Agrobacterium tumefaciens]